MTLRKYCLLPLAFATLAMPALSSADSLWHPANGEVGYSYHPNHATVTKSREQVAAEIAAARKDGTMWLALRGVPIPVRSTAPGNTRQQVADQIRNESVSVRHARMIQ